MKPTLRIALPLIIVLAMLFMWVGVALAQTNTGNAPLDKVVFVHYPKGADLAVTGTVAGTGATSSTFSYAGVRWLDPNGADNQGIPYRINPANPTGVSQVKVVAAVEASFKTWQNANSSHKLKFRDASLTSLSGTRQDRVNVVSWKNLSSSYPGALAVTTVWFNPTTKGISEFDLTFNSAFRWSYTPPVFGSGGYADPVNAGKAGTYDIRNIGTHEAGHTLQLRDLYNAADKGLTMYGYGVAAELRKDSLGYGDVLGLNKVYR